MAGEIIKTQGIVLNIHPWSRTSHIVAWLTPDHGVVTTLVKGAVRPKSAFLGQYDLFYACDLLYYVRATGDLHALREVAPRERHDALRERWRETSLAGYAAALLRELTPPSSESAAWYAFFETFLAELSAPVPTPPDPARLSRALVKLEMAILRLAGLEPDFAGLDAAAEWTPFSIDRGRCGNGTRTVRITPSTVIALTRPDAASIPAEAFADAVRFLGLFLDYHIELTPEIRRALLHAMAS